MSLVPGGVLNEIFSSLKQEMYTGKFKSAHLTFVIFTVASRQYTGSLKTG